MFTEEQKVDFLTHLDKLALIGKKLNNYEKALLLFLVEQYMKISYNEGVGDLPSVSKERLQRYRSHGWRMFWAGAFLTLLVATYVLAHKQ